MRSLALVVLLACTSCSAALSWHECNEDTDCAAGDGGTAYCTADYICVSDVPSDRLCTIAPESSTDPSAMTIGGLFRLSGANEVKDTAIAQAARLAVDQINGQGKRLVRLVLCDTNGDPAQARKAMTTAVDGFHAVAFVGPTSSGEVIGLAQQGSDLIEQYGVPIVSGSATSPAISSLGDSVSTPEDGTVSLVWRTCASDAVQARVLGANDLGANTLIPPGTTSVAVALVDSAYGHGLNDAFTGVLASTYPTLHPQNQAFAEGKPGSDVVAYLQSVAPQVALVIADSDAPSWVDALATGGSALGATQYLLTDGAKSQALLPANPSAKLLNVFARTHGTGPATPTGAAYATFASDYEGAYMMEDPSTTAYTANTYDAVFAIVTASAVVLPGHEVTGTAIASGLARLSDPNAELVTVGIGSAAGFARGYEDVSQGDTINLLGTSGDIDFDAATGDVLTAPIEIWSIDGTTNPQQPVFVTETVIAAP